MWSLRRGFATAAVGGLRLPKLLNSPPLITVGWQLPFESSCAKNLTEINTRPNCWKLIDPEMSELIRLYNSRCRRRKESNTSVDKKIKSDNRNYSNKCKLNFTEDFRCPASKKSSSTNGKNLNKFMTDINKEMGFSGSKKLSFPELPLTRYKKKNFPFEKDYQISSHKSSRNKDIFEISKKNLITSKSSRNKKSLQDQTTFKSTGKTPRQSWKYSSPRNSKDRRVTFIQDTRSYKSKHNTNRKAKELTPLKGKVVKPEMIMTPEMPKDEGNLLSSFPSIDQYISQLPPTSINAHQAFNNYYFEPIDLVKYKSDFLASHSQNPIAIRSSWPKMWPKPLKHRHRKVKPEDPLLKKPSLIKKRCTRKLSDSSFSRTQTFPIPCKYHSFNVKNFQICGSISAKPRAVSCQTEDLPIDCDLYNLCKSFSQQDEPLPVKIKQQDREALRRYYPQICQRKSNSVSVSAFEIKGKPVKTKECINWAKMRRQLEQCQAVLNLCGQLVEAQLRLRRIRAQNACCRCVSNPETGLSFLKNRSLVSHETILFD
ncbi:uncharacterized protein LOC110177926 [Drosophila serrata]|uniref:uncharacterized protein LOC110177926 n=1 Tax=Drosophila serrata TaxID=7274 RepID=UPI000A1D313A|nr:uncharacterized protein LOC110177926 [Drosophila serrata]